MLHLLRCCQTPRGWDPSAAPTKSPRARAQRQKTPTASRGRLGRGREPGMAGFGGRRSPPSPARCVTRVCHTGHSSCLSHLLCTPHVSVALPGFGAEDRPRSDISCPLCHGSPLGAGQGRQRHQGGARGIFRDAPGHGDGERENQQSQRGDKRWSIPEETTETISCSSWTLILEEGRKLLDQQELSRLLFVRGPVPAPSALPLPSPVLRIQRSVNHAEQRARMEEVAAFLHTGALCWKKGRETLIFRGEKLLRFGLWPQPRGSPHSKLGEARLPRC
ncbi:uncharacterized protein LOC125333826 isoform X2 [Corvus hawaiiensis]|uniref:uncharacterized protein LOC125333826 isoform X2 n=1 Tax=Corvus hawaiiensis TaxID=134902 RepID=UPI0020192CFF|nr:uncharacterized protein LOC125333826 isoform X2 [Corvus hawaiiensis]